MAAETGDGDIPGSSDSARVAADLVALMGQDLVFVPRFLGESQERLRRHFRDFAVSEMTRSGLTVDAHPLLAAFADQHAAVLCDFVFTGVALPYQLRIADVERLRGDHSGLLRVDLWDQLKCHIIAAEAKFRAELPQLADNIVQLAPGPHEANEDRHR
ncbi:hypothetical protein [Acidisoma sp. 7E03]